MTKCITDGTNFILDASDTGTGKTYTGLATAYNVGSPVLVVCPPIVIPAWREVAELAEVDLIDVVNVEKLKTGKTPYLKRRHGNPRFQWTLPKDAFVLWDEVQNATGIKTQNAEVLALLKVYKLRGILMSATAADTPLKLRAIGYLLGFHRYNLNSFYTWARQLGCRSNSWGGIEFPKGPTGRKYLEILHELIFETKGVRMRIEDNPDFPDNKIIAEAYDLGKYTKEVNAIYDSLDEEIKNLDEDANPLTVLLRARQVSEHCKVPLLTDMVIDLLDEGKSVAVFLNFREPFKELIEGLQGDVSQVYGGQSERVREENIKAFQANETRVIVLMVAAGGVGVSLHDLHGEHPRVALISPTYSAVHLKQALGRCPRAGAQSKVIQKILFAAGTVEDKACKAVKRKVNNISLINDGDLIEGLFEDEQNGKK